MWPCTVEGWVGKNRGHCSINRHSLSWTSSWTLFLGVRVGPGTPGPQSPCMQTVAKAHLACVSPTTGYRSPSEAVGHLQPEGP